MSFGWRQQLLLLSPLGYRSHRLRSLRLLPNQRGFIWVSKPGEGSSGMGLLVSEDRGGGGTWILSTVHQKPLGHTAKPLALGPGNAKPSHLPKSEGFLPNYSGPKVTESPTSLIKEQEYSSGGGLQRTQSCCECQEAQPRCNQVHQDTA